MKGSNNFNHYYNNALDAEAGSYPGKSHSVAARGIGLINNGAGILERDEVSPSFSQVKAYLN